MQVLDIQGTPLLGTGGVVEAPNAPNAAPNAAAGAAAGKPSNRGLRAAGFGSTGEPLPVLTTRCAHQWFSVVATCPQMLQGGGMVLCCGNFFRIQAASS
jgi:hypothetical protein